MQKRLRELTSQSPGVALKEDLTVYPLKPIGILESCFRQRNGTPRQPLLVPAAKARLKLRYIVGLLSGLFIPICHMDVDNRKSLNVLACPAHAGQAYHMHVLKACKATVIAGSFTYFIATLTCKIYGEVMIEV